MHMQWIEMYRAGLKSSADAMIATVENASRIQQQQLDALQLAVEFWTGLWHPALGPQVDAQLNALGEGLREVPREAPPEQRAA